MLLYNVQYLRARVIIKFNIEKIMKKIVKKWEGGAKKHGGFGKAMGVQIDKWIQSPGRAS